MKNIFYRLIVDDSEPVVAGMEGQTSIALRLNHDTYADKVELMVNSYETQHNTVKRHHEWRFDSFRLNSKVLVELIDPTTPTNPTKINGKTPSPSHDEIVDMEEHLRILQARIRELDPFIQGAINKNGRISPEELFCSFCGKEKCEVFKLIKGPSVLICNECVEVCIDILVEESSGS